MPAATAAVREMNITLLGIAHPHYRFNPKAIAYFYKWVAVI